jgi:hypothetical protein
MRKTLSEEEFIYYVKKHEEYYSNNKHDFHIGEVVIVPKDEMDKEQIGIIKNWSGIDNYVYVLSYDEKSNKHWICGFKEKELKKTNIQLENVSEELYNKYCYYLENFLKIKFI